jgi:hypothetical protein
LLPLSAIVGIVIYPLACSLHLEFRPFRPNMGQYTTTQSSS